MRSPSGRRSRHGSSNWRRLRSFLRDRQVRRVVVLLVLILLGAHLFRVGREHYYSGYLYADVGMGDRRMDVQYGLGDPLATRRDGIWRRGGRDKEAADIWTYRALGGGRVNLVFGGDGRVDSATCVDPQIQPAACPPLYGIGIGEDEERLRQRLGDPDREEIVGDAKIMFYDDLGAAFGLKRYLVYKIMRMRHRGSFGGRLARFVHTLLPG